MIRLWIAAMACAATLSAVAQPAPPATAWRGYDEAADARADIDKARAQATAGGRRVLVVFGANWCGDCRVLDISMKQGKLKTVIDEKFVVVKVDVGRFDRNVDIAQRYGVPLKNGIPAVAVIASDGSPTFVTKGGELADARTMGDDALVRFFDRRL